MKKIKGETEKQENQKQYFDSAKKNHKNPTLFPFQSYFAPNQNS